VFVFLFTPQELIAAGSDIESKTYDGDTPLSIAAFYNFSEFAKVNRRTYQEV